MLPPNHCVKLTIWPIYHIIVCGYVLIYKNYNCSQCEVDLAGVSWPVPELTARYIFCKTKFFKNRSQYTYMTLVFTWRTKFNYRISSQKSSNSNIEIIRRIAGIAKYNAVSRNNLLLGWTRLDRWWLRDMRAEKAYQMSYLQ